jgi:hypothetical protein
VLEVAALDVERSAGQVGAGSQSLDVILRHDGAGASAIPVHQVALQVVVVDVVQVRKRVAELVRQRIRIPECRRERDERGSAPAKLPGSQLLVWNVRPSAPCPDFGT